MRVLIDAVKCFDRPGGERRRLFHFARALSGWRGLELAIILDAEEPEPERYAVLPAQIFLDDGAAFGLKGLMAKRRLVRLVQSFAPAVLLASGPRIIAKEARLLASLRQGPNRLAESALHPALSAAAALLVPSQSLRAQWIQAEPEWASRLVVLQDGVDASIFRMEPELSDQETLEEHGLLAGRYLLVVGALDGRHGTALAIQVRERLAAAGFDLPLVLVGKGPLLPEQDFAALKATLLPQDPGRVLRGVLDEDLAALYRHAHCVLCPATETGGALVPLEAIACGAAVIALDTQAHRERLRELPLRWMPTQDPAAWTAAVIEGLAIPYDLEERRLASAEAIHRARWSAPLDRILELLFELRMRDPLQVQNPLH